ncbi:MAG: molybdopterin-dependent oxidoreductase [Alphaproteobacteria bacterium]|nr:molybdopterin-dependent oxidoreductase [Alphaproteobacteria bacterium]
MARQEIPGFCALCRSRCGQIAVVEADRLVAVRPDPSHPTGAALCVKGRAAPEIVANPGRLLHPLKRTRPKTAAEPGFERISWDEALDTVARGLRAIADAHGPEAVAFAVTSPSGTAISDDIRFIDRFINRFGSPNNVYSTEICNWHKDHAHAFTFGRGIASPDFENAGAVLLWGHNPSAAWLEHATAVAAARARGARIVVVDPRRAGAAAHADLWLRVRPGTDGALALGIAHVALARGWEDRDFLRDWSNGPLMVRDDSGRFLKAREAGLDAGADALVAWNAAADAPAVYDVAAARYDCAGADVALTGARRVGGIACRTAFDRYAALCAAYDPARVARTCWVEAAEIEAAAALLMRNRPVCLYGWSGVGQHTNATQTERAIALLYALTGSFDAPGGNVDFGKIAAPDVSGAAFMGAAQRAKALGLPERPLGPPGQGWVHSRDFYRAVLEKQPYAVRGLFAFGANVAVSHADPATARRALQALDFHVHADVVLNPTAAFADIVLPVCTQWEREALRFGFEVSQQAEELVQLRPAAIAPRGESRSDAWIVFELARRLGFAGDFWGGDIDAAYRHLLAPSGIALEELRARPEGVRVPLATEHRKYRARGFATPTRKVEIYSERLLAHGYDALPGYVEPALSPEDGDAIYPLVLTTAKVPHFCHGQQRDVPSLRRRMPHPLIAIHPGAAASRGIADGDWVEVVSPKGRIRLRARFDRALDPRVVVGQYGWWQASPSLGLPGYDPFSGEGSNYNVLIGDDRLDPISGSVPHRSYLCDVRPLAAPAAAGRD